MSSIRAYYLDEPLSKEEVEYIKRTLAQRDNFYVEEIEEVRVPHVWATHSGNRTADDIEREVRLLRVNLRKANISADYGRRVLWIMPKDHTYQGIAFQLAFAEEIGSAPYSVREKRHPPVGEARVGWFCGLVLPALDPRNSSVGGPR